METIELEIERGGAIDFIVRKAVSSVRLQEGLRSICRSHHLTDAMFELPSAKIMKQFVLTQAYAEEKINKSRIQ